MGQDWKTLGVVVLGAAIAGWLVVRTMTSMPPEHAPRDSARDSAPVATEPPLGEAASAPASAPERPSATAPGAVAATEDVDAGAIVRDLDVLLQALVRDQRLEDRALPRINDALEVPGVTAYRRAPDFWEPALASSEGATP